MNAPRKPEDAEIPLAPSGVLAVIGVARIDDWKSWFLYCQC